MPGVKAQTHTINDTRAPKCCYAWFQMSAAASPVSGAIGAVQGGPRQANEVEAELVALVEAGMDVACFDLSQGTLDMHLDVAAPLVEVGPPASLPLVQSWQGLPGDGFILNWKTRAG